MNTETGVLISMDELRDLSLKEQGRYTPVENKDMTRKQFDNKKISLHDHRSKLGKRLTHIRKSRNMQRGNK